MNSIVRYSLIIILCIFIVFLPIIYSRYYPQNPVLESMDNSTGAREMLTNITNKALRLVEYVKNKYPDDSGMQALVSRYRPTEMYEGKPGDANSTYTENKGEKIVICLRSNVTKQIHEENLVMFPLIHELAHLADINYDPGHGPNFRKYFKMLLEDSATIGIYTPIDFPNDPREFCGLNIQTLP